MSKNSPKGELLASTNEIEGWQEENEDIINEAKKYVEHNQEVWYLLNNDPNGETLNSETKTNKWSVTNQFKKLFWKEGENITSHSEVVKQDTTGEEQKALYYNNQPLQNEENKLEKVEEKKNSLEVPSSSVQSSSIEKVSIRTSS